MLITKKILKIAVSLSLIVFSCLYSLPLFAENVKIIDKIGDDYKLTTEGKEYLTEFLKTCEQPDRFATLQKFYVAANDANFRSILSEFDDIVFNVGATDCLNRLFDAYLNRRINTPNPNANKCQCLDERNNPHGSIEGPITVDGKHLDVDYNTCKQVCCHLPGAPVTTLGAVSWIYNSGPQEFCDKNIHLDL